MARDQDKPIDLNALKEEMLAKRAIMWNNMFNRYAQIEKIVFDTDANEDEEDDMMSECWDQAIKSDGSYMEAKEVTHFSSKNEDDDTENEDVSAESDDEPPLFSQDDFEQTFENVVQSVRTWERLTVEHIIENTKTDKMQKSIQKSFMQKESGSESITQSPLRPIRSQPISNVLQDINNHNGNSLALVKATPTSIVPLNDDMSTQLQQYETVTKTVTTTPTEIVRKEIVILDGTPKRKHSNENTYNDDDDFDSNFTPKISRRVSRCNSSTFDSPSARLNTPKANKALFKVQMLTPRTPTRSKTVVKKEDMEREIKAVGYTESTKWLHLHDIRVDENEEVCVEVHSPTVNMDIPHTPKTRALVVKVKQRN